jgi:hypothetical protein
MQAMRADYSDFAAVMLPHHFRSVGYLHTGKLDFHADPPRFAGRCAWQRRR